MRPFVVLALLLLVVVSVAADPLPTQGDGARWDGVTLTAHEWGTFTSVQGSDGVVLGGLTHHDRDLPSFVHDLTDTANVTGVSPKMETPVVYLYAPEARRVTVHVDFPRGLLTQWYPAADEANHVGPQVNGRPAAPSGRPLPLASGYLRWGAHGLDGSLLVLPREAQAPLPPVADDDPWRFSRLTDANLLRVCSLQLGRARGTRRLAFEHERFLFYRGLGDFALPLRARVVAERVGTSRYEVDLALTSRAREASLRHLFVVQVQGDRAGFAYVPTVGAARDLAVRIDLGPLEATTLRLVDAVADALVSTGLFRDEAVAMARTWQHAWFRDEGLRLLYVLPRAMVDRELPLSVRTHDDEDERWEVVRTFVARTEILTPDREAHLREVVAALAGRDPGEARRALAQLGRWGRFAVPYLRRAEALSEDASVRRAIRAHVEALQLRR